MTYPGAPNTMDAEQQAALLNQTIMKSVADGWRVESQTPSFATLVKGKQVNHVLHLILTVLTMGMWGFVWIILACAMGEKRKTVMVNEFGLTSSA